MQRIPPANFGEVLQFPHGVCKCAENTKSHYKAFSEVVLNDADTAMASFIVGEEPQS